MVNGKLEKGIHERLRNLRNLEAVTTTMTTTTTTTMTTTTTTMLMDDEQQEQGLLTTEPGKFDLRQQQRQYTDKATVRI